MKSVRLSRDERDYIKAAATNDYDKIHLAPQPDPQLAVEVENGVKNLAGQKILRGICEAAAKVADRSAKFEEILGETAMSAINQNMSKNTITNVFIDYGADDNDRYMVKLTNTIQALGPTTGYARAGYLKVKLEEFEPDARSTIGRLIEDFKTRETTYKLERKTFIDKLAAVLENSNSTNQLLTIWAGAEKHFPTSLQEKIHAPPPQKDEKAEKMREELMESFSSQANQTSVLSSLLDD